MAISRGQYGMGGRCTNEYFMVEAKLPEGGCYQWITAAFTRGMAYSQMVKKYPGCKIVLHPTTKERYEEETEMANYWAKHRGSARGPEPIC